MRRAYGTGKTTDNWCYKCGRGGARCFYIGGRVHKDCLTPAERKDYDAKLRASYTIKISPTMAEGQKRWQAGD